MSYTLGVLGGSGLYEMEGLGGVTEIAVDTPYGKPSDVLVKGTLANGTTLLFLPRHGRGHRIPPHQINYRANLCALKKAGATHVVSISAVGSMKEEIEPGHLVVPDQFIDLTKRRISTFFEDGVAGHVPFADPVCSLLAEPLLAAAGRAGARVHQGGTYVCMEGPQFSTRAESRLYRTWGVSVIGMTAMPEAKLAREAELPYATLALATDYDCWHEGHDDVTVEAIIATMKNNVALAKKALVELSSTLPDPTKSIAYRASRGAIMTASSALSDEARARLGWLLEG
ncbi:5'-methylthioadenosine phosphorylase [Labilithrix luteola]|uniref:S-methyl-5'-thioadenosine phosphorylase n=1 Tax=Labilithrix luteola TaxID=1391654 RepID=A0A0K1Q9I4_9BACT|nr:S-methyl-5'-thioadenosine phosphorylase [Labilithrix luteola]AKV02393.1 5'-methylthioadenosine phosphorylase [Labilithrix luteola]